MEKEKSMRDYFHIVQGELQVGGETSEDVQDGLVRLREMLKGQPGPLEIVDELIPKMKVIRDANLISTDAISKVKIPSYLLSDGDLPLGELDKKIQEKFKDITIRIVANNKDQCEFYQKALGKWGFQIDFLQNFSETKVYFENGHFPYILILDSDAHSLTDKDLSVDDVIKIVGQCSKGTRVVVVSSDSDPEVKKRIESYKPVVRTIPKPPTVSQLESAVSIALLNTSR